MSFAGVSLIVNGNLIHAATSPSTASASGYHLVVVEGHSCTHYLFSTRIFKIGGYSWHIKYNPDHDGFISLGLRLVDGSVELETVKAQFVLSLVEETDKQEPELIHGSKIYEFGGNSKTGYHRFITRKEMEKSKHLKDDSFTIRCDIVVLNPKSNISPFIAVPLPDMARNFTDFLLAGEGTDVVFKVGDEMFAAHRCVLAARSTVFRAAFFGPMKEGATSTGDVVQIDDIDAVVFKAMLGFIYGDSLPVPMEDENQGVLLQHLLIAADRYDIPRLRAMCKKKLCEHINVSTVTTILSLADQLSCDGLKKACYQFLRCPANQRAVVATDGFDQLYKSCPPLMKEMILAMLPPN